MNRDTTSPVTIAGGPDFDERGVPTTLAAAKSLDHEQMTRLVRQTICHLEEIDDADIDTYDINPKDNSPLIESQLGVDVFNELTQHLSAKTISVAGIDEWQWSSIAGLATAVAIALRKVKA